MQTKNFPMPPELKFDKAELDSALNELKNNMALAGLVPHTEFYDNIKKFTIEMLTYNQVMNLTAITDFRAVMSAHIFDSIALFMHASPGDGSKLLDVGAGAGFPSFPIKLFQPNLDITALDSTSKKVDFINNAAKKIGIQRIKAIHGRAEELAHNTHYREQYDFVVSRAVAPLSTLVELCVPFLKNGGSFFAYKSRQAPQEIEEAKNALAELGCVVEEIFTYGDYADDALRVIVKVKKISQTLPKYPRKTQEIKKKTL